MVANTDAVVADAIPAMVAESDSRRRGSRDGPIRTLTKIAIVATTMEALPGPPWWEPDANHPAARTVGAARSYPAPGVLLVRPGWSIPDDPDLSSASDIAATLQSPMTHHRKKPPMYTPHLRNVYFRY